MNKRVFIHHQSTFVLLHDPFKSVQINVLLFLFVHTNTGCVFKSFVQFPFVVRKTEPKYYRFTPFKLASLLYCT